MLQSPTSQNFPGFACLNDHFWTSASVSVMKPREKSVIPAVRKKGLPGSGEVVPSVCGREQMSPQAAEKNQKPAIPPTLLKVSLNLVS